MYDALGVVVEEVGESFYNPFIPSTINRLQEAGLVEVEEGMLIIKLPHFVIPLIVRKSDGTYVFTHWLFLILIILLDVKSPTYKYLISIILISVFLNAHDNGTFYTPEILL